MTYEIIEGDCLAVMPTLAAQSVDAIIVDQPYGTTACKWDTVIPFAPIWEAVKRLVKPRAAIVMFASQPFMSALVMSNPAWFKYTWVWNKNNSAAFGTVKYRPFIITEDICVFGDGAVTYNPQIEQRSTPISVSSGGTTVFHAIKVPPTRRTYTTQYPKNLINITKFNGLGQLHPSQKPVALMEYLIRTYTNEGDTVLDFCAGSGSTGVAALNTGRHFIGIEKEPQYAEIARRRLTDAAAQPRLELTA